MEGAWMKSVTVIGPPDHVTMLYVHYNFLFDTSYHELALEIYTGNRTAGDEWRISQGCTVNSNESVDIYPIHVFTVVLRGNRRSAIMFDVSFSFHKKAGPLPEKLPDGSWNCSVPWYPEFESHFRCDLYAHCSGLEDESDCPFQGRCGHTAQFEVDGRCYAYVRDLQNISWIAANIACREKFGGYLASTNTEREWKAFSNMLDTRAKVGYWIWFGLKSVDSGKPFLYQDRLIWADGTIATYVPLALFYGEQHAKKCGAFAGMRESRTVTVIMSCNTADIQHYICEVDDNVKGNVANKPSGFISNNGDPQKLINGTIPFPFVVCPFGHVTHGFMACDAKAACFRQSDVIVDDITREPPCISSLNSTPPSFLCDNGFQRIPFSLVCNFRFDCQDQSDELFCDFRECSKDELLQCATNKQCLLPEKKCNGQLDCVDKSDEQDCASEHPLNGFTDQMPSEAAIFVNVKVHIDKNEVRKSVVFARWSRGLPPGFFRCQNNSSHYYEVAFRCNGVLDCPGHEDEADCKNHVCPGRYKCRGTQICLRHLVLCDKFVDCPEGDDEEFCDLTCSENCTCHGLAFTCPRPFEVHKFPDLRYLDASHSGLVLSQLVSHTYLVHLSLAKCGLSVLGRANLPNLRHLDVSDNRLTDVTVGDLEQFSKLRSLMMAGNPLTSVVLSATVQQGAGLKADRPTTDNNATLALVQTFPSLVHLDLSRIRLVRLKVGNQMPQMKHLNLSHSRVEVIDSPGFQPLSALRTLDLTGCPLSHFPRDVLRGLHRLSSVRTDTYRLCCQVVLPEGFKPLNCLSPEDAVSSCDRLLKHPIHAVFVPLMATVSVVSNLVSVLVRHGVRRRSNTESCAFNHVLSHLCVSDCVMGVYLAILGLADSLYRGTYLWQDVAWRHSAACKMAGFLCVLSNVVSPLLLCLLSVERGAVLVFPGRGAVSGLGVWHVLSGCAWVVGILVSATPYLLWELSALSSICLPIPLVSETWPTSGAEMFGQRFMHGTSVVLTSVLHVVVAAAHLYIHIKTSDNMVTWILKSATAPSVSSGNNIINFARRVQPVAILSCLCRMGLGIVGWLTSQSRFLSDEAQLTLFLVAMTTASSLQPMMYGYGVLQEGRRQERRQRLLKVLAAKRKAMPAKH